MSGKLEGIQKALELYLETKRQIFPRFYFLSSDDVLEILGQSQNPDAMQPHLKKCFDNIKSIEKVRVGYYYLPFIRQKKKENKNVCEHVCVPQRGVTDASGMFSADGEFIPFDQPLKIDRPVEVKSVVIIINKDEVGSIKSSTVFTISLAITNYLFCS